MVPFAMIGLANSAGLSAVVLAVIGLVVGSLPVLVIAYLVGRQAGNEASTIRGARAFGGLVGLFPGGLAAGLLVRLALLGGVPPNVAEVVIVLLAGAAFGAVEMLLGATAGSVGAARAFEENNPLARERADE